MQMVTMVPGQGGAVSISVLPLTIPPARWGIWRRRWFRLLEILWVFSYLCRQHLRGRKSLLRQKRFYPRRGGAWSGCPIRSRKMISWTWCTVPKSKVPFEGQPTWKVQRSGGLLPHDYRIEHRRQDEHTESSDNAGTHKDANRGDKPRPRTQY